jgi:hypothetical protein
MTRRALLALGVGQCLNWGVLYYAFAVLTVPVARDLHVSPWWVTGAFSAALLTSATLSPLVGRWTDHGNGPGLMLGGGCAAVILLTAWTVAPGLTALYAIWIGLGACMAATLYEPAFAIVARALPASERLQALALITVIGGVASTIFQERIDLRLERVEPTAARPARPPRRAPARDRPAHRLRVHAELAGDVAGVDAAPHQCLNHHDRPPARASVLPLGATPEGDI